MVALFLSLLEHARTHALARALETEEDEEEDTVIERIFVDTIKGVCVRACDWTTLLPKREGKGEVSRGI